MATGQMTNITLQLGSEEEEEEESLEVGQAICGVRRLL
jgi:hypothetical protein